MSAYATVEDVSAGFRELTQDETNTCTALLEEAAVLIDAVAPDASADKKKVVSCWMIRRAISSLSTNSVPMGATQGSMTAGPYTQSWTFGTGSSAGELYLSKKDKTLLGVGDRIGSYSPLEGMAVKQNDSWN